MNSAYPPAEDVLETVFQVTFYEPCGGADQFTIWLRAVHHQHVIEKLRSLSPAIAEGRGWGFRIEPADTKEIADALS